MHFLHSALQDNLASRNLYHEKGMCYSAAAPAGERKSLTAKSSAAITAVAAHALLCKRLPYCLVAARWFSTKKHTRTDGGAVVVPASLLSSQLLVSARHAQGKEAELRQQGLCNVS